MSIFSNTGNGLTKISGSSIIEYISNAGNPVNASELEPHVTIIEYKKPSYHEVNISFAELLIKKPSSAREYNTIDSLKRILSTSIIAVKIGKIQISGNCKNICDFSITASGNISLSGFSNIDHNFSITASGGITISGIAVVNTSGGNISGFSSGFN